MASMTSSSRGLSFRLLEAENDATWLEAGICGAAAFALGVAVGVAFALGVAVGVGLGVGTLVERASATVHYGKFRLRAALGLVGLL
jgi:hypothetical protein